MSEDPPGDETPPRTPDAPVQDSEPTDPELKTSLRILLHITRQGRYGPDETPPGSLTQAGIAEALGLSQGAVSNSLTRLVDGGVLVAERSHVRKRMVRVMVYTLTLRGEDLARRLQKRFPDP